MSNGKICDFCNKGEVDENTINSWYLDTTKEDKICKFIFQDKKEQRLDICKQCFLKELALLGEKAKSINSG